MRRNINAIEGASKRLARELREYYGESGRRLVDVRNDLNVQQQALDARLSEQIQRVGFVPDFRFSLPAGEEQKGFKYTRVRDQWQAELLDAAHRAGAAIPEILDPRGELGIPAEEQAETLLSRFGVTELIVSNALASGIVSIDDVEHDLGELRAPLPATPFVHTMQVKVTATAPLDAVVRWLHSLQQPAVQPDPERNRSTSFLTVHQAEIVPADNATLVVATVTFRALTIHPDGLLPEELDKEANGGLKPPVLPPGYGGTSDVRSY